MRNNFLSYICTAAFLLVNLCISQVVTAQKFSIAIFPDSQYAVSHKPSLLIKQMQWLAAKKDSLNLPIVLHVGDIVNYDTITHFQIASDAFRILDDANVDYAVCLGNHDTEAVNVDNGSAAPGYTRTNVRRTTKFNTYFPISRFTLQQGRYAAGKSDNAYYTFKAGGLDWLVVCLEFCARQTAVSWANTIIPKFPHHNVIILTHFHLNGSQEIETSNAGYGDLSPKAIFDQLISKHANVRFVFCGHVSSARSKHRVDIGINGNKIYQMLQDYSTENNAHGNGYLRLLDIDPAAGTISAKMFSPVLNITRNDVSKFSYTGVEFVQPFTTGIDDKVKKPAKILDLKVFSDTSPSNLTAELFSTSDEEVTLTLSSIIGQKISSVKMKVQSHTSINIDMNTLRGRSLSSGVYVLTAKQGNKSTSKKIVFN